MIDPGTFYIGFIFSYNVESYYSVTVAGEHVKFLNMVDVGNARCSYVLLHYATSNKVVVLYTYLDGTPNHQYRAWSLVAPSGLIPNIVGGISLTATTTATWPLTD